MSRNHHAILTAVMLLSGGTWSAGAPQEGAFDGWDQLLQDDFEFDPDQTDVASFAILAPGEVRFGFYRAAEAMKAGRWSDAVEPLQEIINMFPNHFYQVADHPARWVGAGEYARFLLATFPPEARAEYAQWASLRTVPRFAEAREIGSEEILLELGTRWPLTPEGRGALRRLGDYALERGDIPFASLCYRRLLAFEDPPTDETRDLAFRAAASLAWMNDLEEAQRIAAPYLDDAVPVGGVSRPIYESLNELASQAPKPRAGWPTVGGTADHASLAEFDAASLAFDREPSWDEEAFSRPPAGNPYLTSSSRVPEYPFIPTAVDDTLVLCDGLQVRAFSFLSPEPRWTVRGPLYDPPDRRAVWTFEDYSDPNQYRSLGSLGRSLPVVPTIAGDRVIAPLIDVQERGRKIRFDRTDITIPIASRSLHCLDLRSGETLWKQRRPEQPESDFINQVSIANSIVVGDRVISVGYISDGAINVYVVCLSLDAGELLWRTPIMVGQQELTMFNKPFKEFTLQMPAEKDGAVFLSTNLGLIASVETLSGEIRWATQYDVIKIQGSMHYRRPNERDTVWRNDPPIVADGIAVFAPLDSTHFYGVDTHTGKIVWRERYDDRRALYSGMLGVQDGVLIASGMSAIGFYDLRTGKLLHLYNHSGRTRTHNYPAGRGVLADHVAYQPMRDGLLVLEWSKTRTGEVRVTDRYVEWEPDDGGNLLLYRDFQVLVSQRRMYVFSDIDGLVRRARARVDEGQPTVEQLIELADLENQRGDFQAAIDVYDRARGARPVDESVRRRIEDGLFRSHRELAKRANERGDHDAYVLHLTRQAEHSLDDHTFLTTIEVLLELERDRDPAAFLAALDWIDRRCPDAEYPFRDHQHGGDVRARVFTLDQRAKAALRAGRIEDAVAAWQQVLLRYRDLSYEGGEAGEYAQGKIAELMAEHGSKAFELFDAEVARQHEAAMRARDVDALARIVEVYPNASRSLDHRLDLARLLLDKGDHARLFSTLAPILSRGVDPVQKAHSLFLVARAAEAAGDDGLAVAVWQRLRDTGRDVAVLGGEGASYGSMADAELGRLGGGAEQASRSPRLPTTPALTAREMELDATYVHVVPVEVGEPIDGDDVALLYEASGALGEEEARLRLIDLRRMEERWRTPVDQFYNDEDPIVAYLYGGRLVVRQRMTVRAFDPATGERLYQRELPVVPEAVEPGAGLLHLAWREPDGDVVVASLELATGSTFWRRELKTDLVDVEVANGRVLVLGREGLIQALDSLTGEPLYEVSVLELSRKLELRAFPEHDLLVAVGYGDEDGSRYRKTLIGYDLKDGRRLFDVGDLFGAMSVDWLLHAGDSLILPVASGRSNYGIHTLLRIEPRSGKLVDLEVDGLERLKLRRFDVGPAVTGSFAVFVDGDRTSQRRHHPNDRISVIDLQRRAQVHHVDLPMLDQDSTRYRSFVTADGGVFGVIDAWPSFPRECESYVFTLVPDRGAIEVEKIDASGRTPSMQAVTGRSLVVLKENRLYAYSCGER